MKIATIEDLPEISEMAMKFMATTRYSEYSDQATIEGMIESIVTGEQNQKIILLEPGKGFIAGMSSAFPFGPHLLATEIAWWVEPEERKSGVGKSLLEAFEYWAKEKASCTMVSMAVLGHEGGQFYVKNGYELYEQAYMKVL
jgi:GNAT superfamily N-acetyltransferase